MTAASLYRRCRKAGIVLTVNGDKLRWKAPAGVVAPLDELKAVKLKMMAVLQGDYLRASAALLDRIDRDHWPGLVRLFDQRVAVCVADGIGQRQAERAAYQELVRAVEWGRR